MSLVEINKMQEFLISLESTRKYIFFPKPFQVCQFFKLATYLLCLLMCLFVYLSSNYSNKKFRVTYRCACITQTSHYKTSPCILVSATLHFRVIAVSREPQLKGGVFAPGDAVTDAAFTN